MAWRVVCCWRRTCVVLLTVMGVLLALGGEGVWFTGLTQGEKPVVPIATRQAQATAHLSNNRLDLYFSEQHSNVWMYLYAPGNWGESCYHEHFAVYTRDTGTVESHSFSITRPFSNPGGGPGSVTAVLSSGNIQVSRKITVPPGDARYFQFHYTITNTGTTVLRDVRFFQVIDFDIPWTGDHSDDYARYDAATDYIWVYDPEYFQNGIASNLRSSAHGMDYFYYELRDDWDDGNLNNRDSYGPGDPAIGKQFNFGDIPPGESRSVTLTIWFGEPTVAQEPALTDLVILSSNKEKHRTGDYTGMFVRRGQDITVQVGITGDYDEATYYLRFWVTSPSGREFEILKAGEPGGWRFSEGKIREEDILWGFLGTRKYKICSIMIGGAAEIGKHKLQAELWKYDGNTSRRVSSSGTVEFVVLFNPWSPFDPDVYTSSFSAAELDHYILGAYGKKRDRGLNYYPDGKKERIWTLGYASPDVLNVVLPRVSGKTNAANAMEELTKLATRVIYGCWSDRCHDGRGCAILPNTYGCIEWLNIPEMLKEYVRSGTSNRPLGQCLDYAGLVCSFARAIGVPARMLTCHFSNHPIYVYHAWVEVWLNSLSATTWSVADATPGELEGVGTRCARAVQEENIRYSDGVFTYDARQKKKVEILSEYQACRRPGVPETLEAGDVTLWVELDHTEFQVSDMVEIRVHLRNNSLTRRTEMVQVTVYLAPLTDSLLRVVERFDPRSIELAPGEETVEVFTFTPVYSCSSGGMRVEARVGDTVANAQFHVLPPASIEVTAPDYCAESEIVPLTLSVHNTSAIPLENVAVMIRFPETAVNFSERVTWIVGRLDSGEAAERRFELSFGAAGEWPIVIDLLWGSTLIQSFTHWITVGAEGTIIAVAAAPHSVQPGQDFPLTLTVRNTDPLRAAAVEVMIFAPEEITIQGALTRRIALQPMEQVTLEWVASCSQAGLFSVDFRLAVDWIADLSSESLGLSTRSAETVFESVLVLSRTVPRSIRIEAIPERLVLVDGVAEGLIRITNLSPERDEVFIETVSDAVGLSYTLYLGEVPIVHGPVPVLPGSTADLWLVVRAMEQGLVGHVGAILVTAVSADDATAAAQTRIDIVAGTPGCQDLNHALPSQGWHMLSLPGALCCEPWGPGEGGDLTCALCDDLPDFCLFFRWDPTTNTYLVVPPANNIPYQPGMGFWTYVTAPTTLDVSIRPVTGEVVLGLRQGWNQVGNPYTYATATSGLRVRQQGEERPLAEAGAWVLPILYAYDPTSGGYNLIPASTGILSPWQGAWIYALADCELVFTPTAAQAGFGLQGGQVLSVAQLRELGLPVPPGPPTLPKETLGLTVLAYPNPVREVAEVVFVARAACCVEGVRVRVYDVSGRLVWKNEVEGQQLRWNLADAYGRPVANGIYLYVAEVEVGRQWWSAGVQKLLVSR